MLQRKNVLDETEENPGIDDLPSYPVWVDNTFLAGDSDISIQIEELFPRKILIVAVLWLWNTFLARRFAKRKRFELSSRLY